MSDGVGLSVGASNLAAVIVGRAAVSRTSVLTRYPHRPPEVGVPSENPNLNERGLILTDFVDRVGDPVGIVAADGRRTAPTVCSPTRCAHCSSRSGREGHRKDRSGSPIRRTGGRRPSTACATRYPPCRSSAQPTPVVSDATAALTTLRDDPGVPTRGVIALCDFGGTGTSITLVDAGAGYAPLGPTVRHTDLSGDLVDQALLSHVISDLTAAGTIDVSSTSAIGALTQLRVQCRGAKERLSTASVTSLLVDVPGHRGEVRLTRTELDDAIRQPVAEFAGVLQDALERNGVRELAAVASVGGGARIPIITTALSEHFRVPVITHGQPQLTAAIGGGLAAVRGTVDDDNTSMAAAAPAAAATAMVPEIAPVPDEAAPSGTFGALAWSDAGDVPDVAPTDPYDYDSPADAGIDDVRPEIQFQRDPHEDASAARSLPWYRRPEIAMGAGIVVVLIALAAAVLFVLRTGDTPSRPGFDHRTHAAAGHQRRATSNIGDAGATAGDRHGAGATAARDGDGHRTPVRATTADATEPPPPRRRPPRPPPPTTTAPPPPTTQPPPVIPTLPYETIPGLPFVPEPGTTGAVASAAVLGCRP